MSMFPQQPILDPQGLQNLQQAQQQAVQQFQGLQPSAMEVMMNQQQQFQDMTTNVQDYPGMQQAMIPPDLMEMVDDQLMSMLSAFGDTIEFYKGLLTRTDLSVEVQVNAISTTAITLKTFVETLQLMQGATPVQEASETPGV